MRTAIATRQGTDTPNCDRAAVFLSHTGRTAGALLDGTGHSEVIAETMQVLATVAAHVGGQRGALAGLMSAAEVVTDRGPESNRPTGVGVLAVTYHDATEIAWIGDCRAYGWDGATLTRYTTDHTLGEQLRRNGAPWEVAEEHDNWSVTTLCYATIATIRQVQIPVGHLVILTTDGVHDAVEHDRLTQFVRDLAEDPQALADALVAAPEIDDEGFLDDASVVVLAT